MRIVHINVYPHTAFEGQPHFQLS